MKNNNQYCYLNAFMQCLAPISEMRDHYLMQRYTFYKDTSTKKGDLKFSECLYLFYQAMFKENYQVIDIEYLKNIVVKKFISVQQHDSHEFMTYLLSSLQDEETPWEGS